MAVELAVAYVNLVPSAKGMKKGVEDELRDVPGVGDKTGRETGKKFVGAFGVEASKLQDTGKKMAAVGAVVGTGLFAAASAAGNLEAALSANVQVLGEASDAVQDFAKRGVEEVGLSERAVLQAATAFGQLGKVAGKSGEDLSVFSIDMVKLAADLAAFADVPADQAVQDLRAAFAGSTETMQKYNVFLNETELKAALFDATGEKVTGTLTSQQRVLATHAALMAQTGDIQGQAAREADGFQRAQDNLKATLENTAAEIGTTVLPTVTRMVGGLTKGISAVGSLDRASGGMIGTLGGVGAGMLTVGGGAVYAIGKISAMRESMANMSTAAKTATVGFGLLGVAASAYAIQQQRAAHRAQEATEAMQELSRVADEDLFDTFASSLAKSMMNGQDLNETLAELANTNLEGARRLLDYTQAQIDAGLATDEHAEFAEDLAAAIADEEAKIRQANTTTEKHGEAQDDAAVKTEQSAKSARAAAIEMQRWTLISAKLTDQTEAKAAADEEAAKAADEHRRRVDDLYGSLMQLVGGDIAVREANRQASQAVADYRQAVVDGTLSTDELTAAQDDAARAILSAAQATADNEIATREATGEQVSAAEKTDIQREALENLARTLEPNSPLRTQIDGYVNDLSEVPSDVRTALYADVDSTSLTNAELALAELARDRTARVQVRLAGGRLTNDGTIAFGGGEVASANGRFVPGGSNLLSTLGERSGRAGDEVVLPLGNPQRMADLIGHPRVAPAVLNAIGDTGTTIGGRGGVTINGGVHNHNDVDADAFLRRVNVLAAMA